MNILLIEPFYSGSHKQWADQLKEYSKHNIELLTLDGKFWKWRMYGSAITLANVFNESSSTYDLIIVTDMLDLATFISLTHKKIGNIPIITYFHENQFAYPWQENSEDVIKKRDLHYGMINYQTALASSYNLFNSKYNMDSFFLGIEAVNKQMPDNKHDHIIAKLKEKCLVIPLGIKLKQLDKEEEKTKNKIIKIIWNHRLEYDKNPEDFFKALIKLKNEEIEFELIILGEQTKKQKLLYKKYLDELKENIIHEGFCKTSEYIEFLHMGDIIPVTSIHDFFGISIAQGIYTGNIPLLPKRLSYVELYKPKINPEIFYKNNEDFYMKLKTLCIDINNGKSRNDYRSLVEKFDWSQMIGEYDAFFEEKISDY